jgi:hypothetical protein
MPNGVSNSPGYFALPVIGVAAFRENPCRRGKGQHIVHCGGFAVEAGVRGQGRLCTHLAALALDALEQRGFLATDVRARTGTKLNVEIVFRIGDPVAKQIGFARFDDRSAHCGDRVRIFRAAIDHAFGGADRYSRDGHAFDEQVRIAFHQHAICEGTAVAFVGVADDVFLAALCFGGGAPFDAGGESCAAASAQSRLRHFLDDLFRSERKRPRKPPAAAVSAIIVN